MKQRWNSYFSHKKLLKEKIKLSARDVENGYPKHSPQAGTHKSNVLKLVTNIINPWSS